MKRCWGFLLLIVCLFCACSSSSKKTLFIFTWGHFFDPELVATFEKQYDCSVIIDTFDSNESMYAKLKLGASHYDLIIPSHYYLNILDRQNMIHPIDKALIPHLADLDPKYFQNSDIPKAVPFVISFSGLGYRKDRLPLLKASWGVFGENSLAGRMTMLNDIREVFGAALKFLGYSVNTVDPEQLAEATQVLLSWKQNLAKFESEQYKNGVASAEFLVVQGYSIDIFQVHEENPQVDFLFPEEGSILSTDYFVIPKSAQNIPLAHLWINFFLDPEHAAQNMAYHKSLMPVLPAYALLDDSLRGNPMLFPPASVLQKMEQLDDVGEHIRLYYEMWERVKTE